jgi:hypothetical protein
LYIQAVFIRTSDLFIDNHNLVDGRVFKVLLEFLGKVLCPHKMPVNIEKGIAGKNRRRGRATPVIL